MEQGVHPIDVNRTVLGNLGRKMQSGSSLTTAEKLMALSASASVTADIYGPGPDTMVVKTMELPESVKGMLVEYAG
jgi:hypothetical protein